MSLQAQLDHIFAKTHFEDGKYHIERMQNAVERFGNPQLAYEVAHITGTNGKGSTAKMLSTVLSKKYKVGLYTSPHLVNANERFLINGKQISDETLSAYLEQLEQHAPELTFFETMTMVAFLYFRDEKVDYAVFEVGMGGLLDATNVVDAKINVITSISLDHTKTLGESVLEIGKKKAGIIKEKADVFVTLQNKLLGNVFFEKCVEKQAKLHWVKETDKRTALRGSYQKYNAGLVVAVARHVGIPEQDIDQGLLETKWPGRMQFIADNILVDGAHNEAAIIELGAYLRSLNKTIVILYGTSHSRGDAMLKHIRYEKLVLTQPDMKFATPLEEYTVDGERIRDVREAFERAKAITPKGGLLVVTGSLYLVGNILSITHTLE